MLDNLTTFEKWLLGALAAWAAVFVYILLATTPLGEAPLPEIERTDSRVEAQTHQESRQDRQEQASETRKVTEDTKISQKRNTTVERFDPATGKLVYRKQVDTDRTQETNRNDESGKQASVTEKSEVKVDTETKTQTRTETQADRKTGFQAGVLLTSAGFGPLVSYRVVSMGPVGLDAGLGLVGSLSPRAGVFVAGEVLPRVTGGLGVVVGPGGSEPLAYRVGPFLDLTAGAVLQYQF